MREGLIDAPESTLASEEPFRFPLQTERPMPDDAHPPETVSDASRDTLEGLRNHSRVESVSRCTQKPMSVDLPAFSFNPATSASGTAPSKASDPSDHPGSSPLSPANKSHRRATSAHVGGEASQDPLSDISTRLYNSLEADQVSSNLLSQPIASRKGHRHRRSAALSSQDLSATARQTASEALRDIRNMQPVHTRPSVQSLESSTSRNAVFDSFDDVARRASRSTPSSKTPSPSRVSFSEKVDIIPDEMSALGVRALPRDQEVPTRPRSAESALRAQQQLQGESPRRSRDDLEICQIFRQNSKSLPQTEGNVSNGVTCEATSDVYAAEQPSVESGNRGPPIRANISIDDANEINLQTNSPYNIWDTVALNENFDEDPTSAAITDIPKSRSLPTLSATACPPFRATETDSSEALVDIDDALNTDRLSTPTSHEELKNLRGKGFSAARKSLHSAGLSGFMAPGLHRRSESAPSTMLETEFKRPVLDRFNDASASEKGFEMNNVFEEEEDEASSAPARRGKVSPLGLSNIVASGDVGGGDDDVDDEQRNSSSTLTVKSVAPLDKSTEKSQEYDPSNTSMMSAPSTPDQNYGSRASSSYGQGNSCFGTPQTDVTSSFTDARRPSAAKHPNTITQRGGSVASFTHTLSTLQGASPSAISPAFLSEPLSTGSSSSMPSISAERRKRSSIVSLSRLIGPSTPGRSNLSVSQTSRCQTSDGIEPPTKEKRSKRLGQKLKHWKAKISSQL